MRTVGVEEELLLVDPAGGRAVSRAAGVLGTTPGSADPGVSQEFTQQMVEIQSRPHEGLDALERDLRSARERAASRAAEVGAAVAALATSPLPVDPVVMDTGRYRRIREEYGALAREHLSCGCHVHVAVAGDEEGVAVLDRVRVWLPVLLAVSANSPFRHGEDTGYASYRWQLMARWPVSGPPPAFGSAEGYRSRVRQLVGAGVIDEPAMVYFDARLAEGYPTVELRVADVCSRVEDTVLLAALSRALVETAARQWRQGHEAPQVDVDLLRLATWRASRHGLEGDLLDPGTWQPHPAPRVVAALLEHLGPALRDAGDEVLAQTGTDRVLRHGTGAALQREAYRRTRSLGDVVAEAVRTTSGG